MKTKDFIKILQVADPTGEHHIRFNDIGIPVSASLVPGYWDGAYSYFDEKGIYVETSTGSKVDIYTVEVEDIVWEEDGDMDKIRKRIKLDYENYSDANQRKEKYDNFWKRIEEEAIAASDSHKILSKEYIASVISDMEKGYTFVYNTEVKHKFGNIFKVKFFIKHQCNIGEHEALLENPDIFELSTDSIRCRCDSNIKIFKLIKK